MKFDLRLHCGAVNSGQHLRTFRRETVKALAKLINCHHLMPFATFSGGREASRQSRCEKSFQARTRLVSRSATQDRDGPVA
jgi:hypothetical protein